MTTNQKIKKRIEEILSEYRSGGVNIIIYPFGDVGMQVKAVLNQCYGINELYIIDNNLCQYNEKIKHLEYLSEIKESNLALLIATEDDDLCATLRKSAERYISENNIYTLGGVNIEKSIEYSLPKVGKYSTGDLCSSYMVESIGAFCSFAYGCTAVMNHPIKYISTNHMFWCGGDNDYIHRLSYDDYKCAGWHMDGVHPRGELYKSKKSVIGNDVWLGQNVIITNGANIGNGVIAGAGAVITKDVPDYAVVAGVPAKIIRYRYTLDQIDDINKIAWWDWSDDKIRQNYDDFYLPIEDFIDKHKRN